MAQDSPTKTCTHNGCDRPLRARGLCSTHYNQTQTNRHRKVTVTCEGCGVTVERATGVRYGHTYCSDLCYSYARWGGSSCDLPAEHMARCIGRTCEWTAPPQPRAYICEWCGSTAETGRSSTRYCADTCARAAGRRRRRAREHGAIGTYSWAEVTRLWLQFDRQCAYCHTPTNLSAIQAEHVYPLSKGGANNLTNLLPSCGGCNADKRDLLLHDWQTDRERRGLPPVTTTWRAGDSRYKHLVYRTNLRMSA